MIGVLAASDQGLGVKLVPAGIGCVEGTAIGGAIRKALHKAWVASDALDGQSDGLAKSQRELNDNYWIHHGHLSSAPGLPDADDPDISE